MLSSSISAHQTRSFEATIFGNARQAIIASSTAALIENNKIHANSTLGFVATVQVAGATVQDNEIFSMDRQESQSW